MMVLAAVCWLWSGMVLAISFMETPVKFTAPSVTLQIGLDVGRHVFGIFNKVEIGWALLGGGLILWTRPDAAVWLPLTVAGLMLALQSAWLLPGLDARTEMILRGQTLPRSPLHLAYIALEAIKLIGLIVAGIACLGALRGVAPAV